MSHRPRRVLPLAFALSGLALSVACASPQTVPPVSGEAPAASAAVSAPTSAPPPVTSAATSASSSPSVAPASSGTPAAACAEGEVRDPHGRCVGSACPQGKVLGSDGTCKDPAPCIDGELMMGACLCPKGKSVDETGHCVFSACPKGTTGGTVFRTESGECMECRPGTVPCGDHCCPGGGRKR